MQDVAGTGRAGEVKDVATGYARNYLLPKGLAVPATEGAQKNVQHRKTIESSKTNRAFKETTALAEKLSQQELVFKVKLGEQMRMHGSITNADIADELRRQTSHEVDKHKVDLQEPIRNIGTYEVLIHVAKDAVAKVKVIVEEG